MLVGKPIKNIRKTLHQNPEVSREEVNTAFEVAKYFAYISGYTILKNLGYHSLVAYKKFGEGPGIGFRAELDGLPIQEESYLDYRSKNPHKSHACGHDGHMTILLALAKHLEENPINAGTVYFIFQSAEETGEGAKALVETPKFQDLEIDFCYSLHNIPGKEKGLVVSKTGSFACASVGFAAEIIGKTAHAAHPEDAINPLEAAIELWAQVKSLPENQSVDDFALATSIALHAGEKTFGTSPVNARLLVTMRAAQTDHLDFMMDQTNAIAKEISAETGAKITIRFQEYFPATENSDLLQNLKQACENSDTPFMEMEKPFRWSEDFAYFSKKCPALMFGLGSGISQPALHAPDFDFPDEIIESGRNIFYEIFKIHTGK